jgi:hypothetical protein
MERTLRRFKRLAVVLLYGRRTSVFDRKCRWASLPSPLLLSSSPPLVLLSSASRSAEEEEEEERDLINDLKRYGRLASDLTYPISQ